MRTSLLLVTVCAMSLSVSTSIAGLYGDPPDERHPWAVHDLNRERPAIVAPGINPQQDGPPTHPGPVLGLKQF